MTIQHALSLAVVLLAVTPRSSLAQAAEANDEETSAVTVLVETDPATFVQSGYALHVRIAPAAWNGWVLGAGVYGQDFPALVAGLHPDNDDQWRVSLDRGYGLFADYHFEGKPEGFFIGAQLAWHRFDIRRVGSDAQAKTDAVLAMARLGFLWTPFEDLGLYVMPWIGAGGSLEVHRKQAGAGDYHALPVLAFGALHIGWAFEGQ